MKIYKAELKDGLGDKLQCNTIAHYCAIEPYTPSVQDIKTIKALAENKNQVDLYYIKSILVSTGWNKNDDVFDPAEMWQARSTPEDKQFNYMHNEKDIIGHITGSHCVDRASNILPDINDMSQVPSEFDIVTGAVLYTSWTDDKLKDRMQDIITEIEQGKTWFVSMECLFPAFDYCMMDAKGNQKIVKREESSAFLTKHLKSYGGSGEYNGHKVGRLLRNFAFSGVGLVKKPANPRSVILNSKNSDNINDSKAEEIIMTDELEILKAELAEAKKACEEVKEEMAKKKAEEASASEAFQALQDSLAETKEELKKTKEKAEMDKMELDKMKKEKMTNKRKAELIAAGLEESEVEEAAAKFESLSDEVFETVIATLTKAVKSKPNPFENAKQPPAEKKENEPAGPSGDKVKNKKPQASMEIELDPAEASEDVLDSAEADADIAMAESGEDVFESVKSFASEWFSDNVLKSTANLKK